mgnify:CR=1 FL=1
MPNPAEGERSLCNREAIDYLGTIRETYTKISGDDFVDKNLLHKLVTLVVLEEAHFYWLAKQSIAASGVVVIHPTGFPSLPTMISDAEAALVRHGEIIGSRQRAILDVLADLANMDADRIRQYAPQRAKRMAATKDPFVDTIQHLDTSDLLTAVDTIVAWRNPRQSIKTTHWTVAEKNNAVMVELHQNKEIIKSYGYRFFPVPPHSFFLVCTPENPSRGGIVYSSVPENVIPTPNKNPPTWLSDLSNFTRQNGDRTQRSRPLNAVLFTYDPFVNRRHTEKALRAILEVNSALARLASLTQRNISEKSSQDDPDAIQQRLAAAIADIQALPPELSEFFGAAVKDMAREVGKKLPATPLDESNNQTP